MKVITNNVPRSLLYWHDLTESERDEFDYESASDSIFVRYKGITYDFGEFMRITDNSPFGSEWDAYSSETAFNGVLLRLCDDHESVVIGSYFS